MKYFYGTLEIEDNNLTPSEVKKIWASVHPEIENAVAEERQDGIHFVQRSGTKGMKYFYGTLEIEDNNLTPSEVKKIWASVHPEIENAVAEERQDGIHFVQRSGTKGY